MSLLNGAFEPESLRLAGDVLAKLGIGALIGGIIGFEREHHGRPAGIRTHILMVVGVVLFCEVSKAFAPNDQARIAAQILTGVGFLGAGTILRLGAEIKGLTSAASVWAAASLGMAVSVGGAFLWVALAGTLLTIITLTLVEKWEYRWLPLRHRRSMQVRLENPDSLATVMESIAHAGGAVLAVRFASRNPPVMAVLDVQGVHDPLLLAVGTCSGVLSAQWMD